MREALIEAGASPAKADKASEELATYENRMGSIELKMEKLTGEVAALRGEMKGEFNAVRGEINAIRGEIKGEFSAVRGEINGVRGEINAIRGEIKGESLARNGQIEGLRSEIRVYSLVMGVILSIIAAGFWHVLPAGH